MKNGLLFILLLVTYTTFGQIIPKRKDVDRSYIRLGLERVTKDGEDYFLDEKGQQYPIANEIEEVTEKTTALILSGRQFKTFPVAVFEVSQLKILIINGWNYYENYLKELPNGFKQLEQLEILSLRYGNLTQLPDDLGELPHLQQLDLLENRKLPSKEIVRVFKNASQKIWLINKDKQEGKNFEKNTLLIKADLKQGLPYNINELKRLIRLDLFGKSIQRLPESLSQLTELTHVDLEYNNLRVFPNVLVEIPSLKVLKIWRNYLSEVPSQISQLKNLEVLDLQRNTISELPQGLWSLKKLKKLSLYSNLLTRMDDSIQYLVLLEELNYGSNRIEKVPHSIKKLKKLRLLDLSANQFLEFPEEVCNLKKLGELGINYNRKMKSFPESIGQLKRLKKLNIRSCQLPKIPKNIGKLRQLEDLDLGYNQFTTIPSSIKKLKKLRVLKLNDNKLTEVPSSIFGLKKLTSLGLDYNKIKTVHSEIGELKNLKNLELDYNLIKRLPNTICQLSNLQKLWLDGNDLTELPENLGALDRLYILSLDYNNLRSLPESIGNCKELKRFYVEGNLLKELPASIKNLKKLNEAFFSFNRLTEIPSFLEAYSNVKRLFLHGNNFSNSDLRQIERQYTQFKLTLIAHASDYEEVSDELLLTRKYNRSFDLELQRLELLKKRDKESGYWRMAGLSLIVNEPNEASKSVKWLEDFYKEQGDYGDKVKSELAFYELFTAILTKDKAKARVIYNRYNDLNVVFKDDETLWLFYEYWEENNDLTWKAACREIIEIWKNSETVKDEIIQLAREVIGE